MKLQITLITPTPRSLMETLTEEENTTEFDQMGSWDEIFYLGKQVPLAAVKAFSQQMIDPKDTWACMDLVHFHATRDHLVLIDPSIVQVSAEEELALRNSVLEVLEHYLETSIIPMGSSWLFCTHHLASLKTSSVELTKGRNIDIWMPKDTYQIGIARKWRQMQNEIQMIWHDHPVNAARLARGELPVNSVWLHGLGSAEQIVLSDEVNRAHQFHGDSDLMAYLAKFLGKPYAQLDALEVQLKRQLESHHKGNLPESEVMSGNHLIDLRNSIDPTQLEAVWQICLSLLKQTAISDLQLITEHHGQTLTSTIELKHFKSGFFRSLFLKKKSNSSSFPSWEDFSSKIQWLK